MQDIFQEASALKEALSIAVDQIGLEDITRKKSRIDDSANDPNLWQDNERAQSVLKEQSQLEKRITPWQNLRRSVDEILELAALNDSSLKDDLTNQLAESKKKFDVLKDELKFSGVYDDHDVIFSIHAGAGGTDAQDWAQMLLRMYVRWAEKSGYSIQTVDESVGDEAGIKSATIELSGLFAYGKLKGEHGVHRLVRLSPFNSDNLRQTSFAKIEIAPKIDKPDEVEIDDKDLRIDVYRSGGHGGQSVNTTDSAVRITHIPTRITVAIQNERSQLQNKETALGILRSKLAQLQLEQHAERVSELKGPNEQAAWGNQIRSYVLHPYKQVKDLRTRFETSDVEGVLDGDIDGLIDAYLEFSLSA